MILIENIMLVVVAFFLILALGWLFWWLKKAVDYEKAVQAACKKIDCPFYSSKWAMEMMGDGYAPEVAAGVMLKRWREMQRGYYGN